MVHFEQGDIVVVINCPKNWMYESYKKSKASGHIEKLGYEASLLNSNVQTAMGDNSTGINYTRDCLRLATEEESYAYKIGVRNIKDINLSELDMQCLLIQREINENE